METEGEEGEHKPMCLPVRISEQASAGGHCHIHYLLPAFNEDCRRGREARGRQGREGSWAETEAAQCGPEPGEG